MPRVELTLLAAHIRRIAPPGAEALTDADLVGRYAEHRDAAAFEVLVWRHGPMVWAACRRVLRHQHDVEDAFQATFLALARAAPSIAARQAVAGWLHRVATNAALKLKANRRAGGLTADVPDRPAPDDAELAGAVDEELERLPDRMRAAFVLCGLEGMTSAEAARELGCPVGTVDSRLHAARTRLRDRLTRRGFGTGVLSGLVLAAVPSAATAAAVGLGSGVAPSSTVNALAAQAARSMTSGGRTMKAVTVVLAAAFAGAVWAYGGPGGGPVPTPTPGAVPTAPGEPDPGRIALWREGHPVAFSPGTKGTTALGTGYEGERGSIRLGPDGRLLAYVAKRTTARPADPEKRDRVYVRDGTRTTEVKAVTSPCHAFWGADGLVYGYGFAAPKGGDPETPPDLTADIVNWSFDPRTGKANVLRLPGAVSVLDVAPDGKTFLVLRYAKSRGVPGDYQLGLVKSNDPFVPLTKLGEALPGDFRFSPDGRRALGSVYREEAGRYVPDLFVFDLTAGTRTAVAVPKNVRVQASCWSPDGKRIAYVWEARADYDERNRDRDGPVVAGREKKPRVTVTVARPDGSDAKDVYTETEFWFGSIDWAGSPAGQPPGAAPAPGGGQAIRPVQPPGVLGERLGEYHTIEGVRIGLESGKVESGTVLVDTVDGKKLNEPIALPVRLSDSRGLPLDLPVKTRCVLKGYELGEMIGRPPAEYALAKERGQDPEELAKRDATVWRWRPYFVALVVVEPKGLEVPKR